MLLVYERTALFKSSCPLSKVENEVGAQPGMRVAVERRSTMRIDVVRFSTESL